MQTYQCCYLCSKLFRRGKLLEWYINNIIICHFAVAARCKNNSASDDGGGIINELEFPDLDPFMAPYCKNKKDMPEAEKTAFMTKGMNTLRNCEHMRAIIDKMFDLMLKFPK